MPARSRTRKWDIDKRMVKPYLKTMFYNLFLRDRRLLLSLGIVLCLYAVNHYYSKSSLNTDNPRAVDRISKERKIIQKIVEINDRQPSYKLYIYEGYEVSLDRKRAQVKLLDDIKLHDRCQQNPKTIVVDVGASLGQFGLYAAACGCQVYMFEVDPMKISLLKMSIKLNSFESRVHLITKAVSDLPPNSQIYISLNTSSQVSSDDKQYDSSNVFAVETINFNKFNFSSEIYLLRVDVEGYEIHVFRASEKLFQERLIHHVLFQYTPSGTDRILQNDLLGYIRDILGGRRFYALHPKQATIYGPLYNEDIDLFYTQHHAQNLERDVYVLFQDEDLSINSKPYNFVSSFD